MIFYIINSILFMFSNLGFWVFLKKKTTIDKVFLPLLTVGIQIFILFFAGMLNILTVASFGMYFFGFYHSIKYLYSVTKNKFKFKQIIKNNIPIVYLFLFFILITFILYGAIFTSYDNFSHWGLVVKTMLKNNRFPNYLDTVIHFQQYPLGSSSYIYYFSRFVSYKESAWLVAQAYIMLCAFIPLTKYIKKNKVVSYTFLTLFINFMFCFGVTLTFLLVDSLLPIFSFGVLLFIYENVYKKNDLISLILTIPLLSSIMLIKNSGIYFVALIVIYLIYIMIKTKQYKNIFHYLTIASPFITYYLWTRHCKYVFMNASVSRHSMSIDNYSQELGSKTAEQINQIVNSFLKFSVTGYQLYTIILFTIAVIALVIIGNKFMAKKKDKIKGLTKQTLIILALYITYMIGTLAMYLISMPIDEALTLASSIRYRSTIFSFIYIILAMNIIRLLSSDYTKKNVKYFMACAAILSTFFINYFSFAKIETIFDTSVKEDTRIIIQDIFDENKLDYSKKYIFALDEDDHGYVYYMSLYLFDNPGNNSIVVKDGFDNSLDGYDYLIDLTNDNELMKTFINEKYPSQKDSKAIDLSKEG